MRGTSLFAVLTLTGAQALALPSCPEPATLTVFAKNLSDSPVDVTVDGELVSETTSCAGVGGITYPPRPQERLILTCPSGIPGSAVVRCGQLTGLHPGVWIHRLKVTVPGSEVQQQAQRLVLLAGNPTDVSNALVWTVYPRTFVVSNTNSDESEGSLRRQLKAADDYTAPGDAGLALVTFSSAAFPGASVPTTIDLSRGTCDPDPLHPVAICFTGSHVVVDALDASGTRGSVIWSVGMRDLSLLSLYGSENVFRGIVFAGSQSSNCVKLGNSPDCAQFDTVAITGGVSTKEKSVSAEPPVARRNTIEQCTILGPTHGDAVSVDSHAGAPDDEAEALRASVAERAPFADANVITETRITGAEDKGIKVDLGGFASIERSCVHDNLSGGIQSTLGGHATAMENIVQHNAGGPMGQNGITVIDSCGQSGCMRLDDQRSELVTRGNIVRFSGQRGLAVRDNATADVHDDYLADNLVKGSVVETTDLVPLDDAGLERVAVAQFRGVAVVCNRYGDGVGAETRVDAHGVLHAVPDVDYGDAQEPGRNAFSSNKVDAASANFLLTNIPPPAQEEGRMRAVGNQWARCGSPALCDLATIREGDMLPPDPMGQLVDLGEPLSGPRVGAPVLLRITPARPAKGDIVRIFGENFNAIEGNPTRAQCPMPAPISCSPAGTCPTGPCVNATCPCSIENEAVQLRNEDTGANRIRIMAQDGTILADDTGHPDLWPDAVTPTMLAFRMPFDCFAPLTIEVTKNDPSGKSLWNTIPMCDPKGCHDAAPGAPCDDGNPCTPIDQCDGNGRCVGIEAGNAGSVCRLAAGICDMEEQCDGSSKDCPIDAFLSNATVCRSAAGVCDQAEHCSGAAPTCPADAKRVGVCRIAAGPCDVAETCDGTDDDCPADAVLPAATVCRSVTGSCDVPEKCDGISSTCPTDSLVASGTECRPASDPCRLPDTCTGMSPLCPQADQSRIGCDAILCGLERSIAPPECTNDPVPVTVARLFDRAKKIMMRSPSCPPKRSRCRRAKAKLNEALALVRRFTRSRKHPISVPCIKALGDVLTDAVNRLGC
jgi:hypothetical protein